MDVFVVQLVKHDGLRLMTGVFMSLDAAKTAMTINDRTLTVPRGHFLMSDSEVWHFTDGFEHPTSRGVIHRLPLSGYDPCAHEHARL